MKIASLPAFLALATLLLALSHPPVARAVPLETNPDLKAKEPAYAAGLKAIEAGNWQEAVERLRKAAIRRPDSADVHNMLGFAYRNLGQYEPAFRHYERALHLDPTHRGAHEYIGEAYLMTGDLAHARKHLEALQALCPKGCEELDDLDRAIAKYRKERG